MALSAAEKRELLRQKRAAKMQQNGENRIGQILGTSGESNQTTSINTANHNSTPELKSEFKKVSTSDVIDDPPMEIPEDMDVSLDSGSPLQEFVSNEAAEQKIEEILANAFSNHSSHLHGKASNNDTKSPFAGLPMENLFSNNMEMPTMTSNMTKSQEFMSIIFPIIRIVMILTAINNVVSYQSFQMLPQWMTSYLNSVDSPWLAFTFIERVIVLLHIGLLFTSYLPKNTIFSFDVSSFSKVNYVMNIYSIVMGIVLDFCAYLLFLKYKGF